MTNNTPFQISGLVVLVLSTRAPSYNNFKNAIRNTWFKSMKERGVRCYFYEGGSTVNYLEGDTIYLNCDDSLKACAKKLRSAVRFVKELDGVELIFRTNLSSYIDTNIFIEVVSSFHNLSEIYLGRVGNKKLLPEYFYGYKYIKFFLDKLNLGSDISFCSGAAVFIGSKYFKEIAECDKYDRFVDDIMLRLCVGVEPNASLALDRFDFVKEYDSFVTEAEYIKRVEEGLFHYRFKTDNRILDSKLLEIIHDEENRFKLCTLQDEEGKSNV